MVMTDEGEAERERGREGPWLTNMVVTLPMFQLAMF